jgi:hypothetical protein
LLAKIPQEKEKGKKPSTSKKIPQVDKLRVLREEMFWLNYEPIEELTQVDPETFHIDDVILRREVDEI